MTPDDPEKIANDYRDLVDDLFDLRVLDPAMGSGHFLVEAVDFITDGLLDFLNAFRWNPITAELRRTRETILEEMQRQGVIVDPARLTDVNLLKRHVLKRCVYGVDLNPMAVELAKVSLWLDCFTVGAPLSFLDHHLKRGNSLIGARIKEVREAVDTTNNQMGLFGTSVFTSIMLGVDLMRQVGEQPDLTAEQVRQSRAEYREASDTLAPFKRIMDVYLSRWFGNVASKQQARFGLEPTVDFLRNSDAKAWLNDPQKETQELSSDIRPIATIALAAATDKAFFHWELEFPEVFFGRSSGAEQVVDLREDGGFDAVVGNPPYDVLVNSEDPHDIEQLIDYFENTERFLAARGRKKNLFRLFLSQGVHLFSPSVGHIGMIVPHVLLSDESSRNLRRSFLADYTLMRIDSFPEEDDINLRVFPEAKQATCVVFLFHGKPKANTTFELAIHPTKYIDDVSSVIRLSREVVDAVSPIDLSFPEVDDKNIGTMMKIHNIPNIHIPRVYQGEVNLTNFGIFLSTRENEWPILKGVQIGRYQVNDELSQGEPFWLDLPKVKSSGRSVRYEHSQRLRIAMQGIMSVTVARRLNGIVVPNNEFLGHSTNYFFSPEGYNLYFLLCLLNGTLWEWRFRLTSTSANINTFEIENLPIPRISFMTPTERRASEVERGHALYKRSLSDGSDTALRLRL